MKVMGYDPFLSVEGAWGLSSNTQRALTLEEIYANCDYISLHVPLTPDTKEMINAATIAQMKEHVRILNFARGDLVIIQIYSKLCLTVKLQHMQQTSQMMRCWA